MKAKKQKVKKNRKIRGIKRTVKNRKLLLLRKKSAKKSREKRGKKKVMVKKFLKKKSVVKHRAKKPRTLKLKTALPKESFFKANIKVIGIGGGGSSIVSEIGRSLDKATFVIADTDVRAFQKRKGIKYFLFGKEQTHGLGTGLNPDLAIAAAQQEKEKIAKLFENQDVVIFIASLGGGVGSGATKVFAEISKSFGGISFGIFTLPFKFEGTSKQTIAKKALRELRTLLNVSITIPNERIFKIIDENTAITEAFSIVNKNLIESLESLIELISNPGIINIDFADLRTILQGRGNLAFLNTTEAFGKLRAEKTIQEILRNPLYAKNNFTAQKILFNISGGNNLSMVEVDKISRSIAEQNRRAKIIFGISKNSKYKNKIKTTLLMTGTAVTTEKTIVKKESSFAKALKNKEKKKVKKTIKAKKRKNKPPLARTSEGKEKIPFENVLMPVFNNEPVGSGARALSVVEIPQKPKKPIRRTALQIKEAQEVEESKKSLQEKEWEIPAFLRKVKFKP